MGDDKCGGGVGVGDSSRASTSFVKAGDRQVFSVELRPGETTIVSWKKLVKDANKVSGPTSAPEPPLNAHPGLESRIASGQPTENEAKDASAPNRFSAVIEKIERLYMGKDSSDEEDPFPDDDQYDTEDSFIDDAELDEYFEVDNSAIKHDGFFVNRGKLERTNEPSLLPNQQQKKRRRKDLVKGQAENDVRSSNKHLKLGKTADGKTESLVAKNISNPSQNMGDEIVDDGKLQNQLNSSGLFPRKKSADTKVILDPSLSIKVGDSMTSLAEGKETDQQKTGVSKNLSNKSKESSATTDASHQKFNERSSHIPPKPQSGRLLNNIEEVESSIQLKEKNGLREVPDINLPAVKNSIQVTKASHSHRKDGSSVRPKSSTLEKSIRELERMVAESRPPAMENQEADSSQAIKRRLPREVKLKLAKVARLAQASHGKISKELINRLMSILGHIVQLRTLKRNLKVMVSMGLSAKQEKDVRFQQIKKEVVEMIKVRPSTLDFKAFEKQAGASDDLQDLGSEEKAPKRKFSMDAALEDKICDLYDLFVDGLDEDAGPQIRKLYAELAELWPNGFMDNHGIKRAICRAKERRRALYSRHKDQEKLKRKKMLASRIEETVRAETGSAAQPQYTRERLSSEASTHSLTSVSKPVSITSAANMDRHKPEKLKGISSSNSLEDAVTKKKEKRKAELELDEIHIRPDKLPAQQGDERNKSLKQSSGLHKLNLQSTDPPSLEQSS